MRFKDGHHKAKFDELTLTALASRRERDYIAALYILSSPLLAWRCSKYVECRGIKFIALKRASAPWSSGEKALVKLAAALFNSSWKCDINDAFYSLDDSNTQLAMEALRIRFE